MLCIVDIYIELKNVFLAYFFHDMIRYFYVDVSKTLLKIGGTAGSPLDPLLPFGK